MIATALLAVACVAGMAVVLAWATHRKARGAPSVDAHEATTAHAELLYPFQTSGGLQAPGVFIGRVTTGWAPFTFDPWELYRQGVVTNANMVVAGQIGRGKSAFVKSLIWRNAAFGRKAVVIDPKGEYQPLVRELGGTVIALEPGGPNRINPLDSHDTDHVARTLTGLVAANLKRDLRPEEKAGLIVAHRTAATTASRQGRTATLPDVAAAMLTPTEAQAGELHTTVEALAAGCREAGLALWELCEGGLRGMFDGPTNITVDWDAPIIVVDISALGPDSPALGVVMAAALAWIHPVLARSGAGQRFLLLDEAWFLLSELALARWLQSMFKLSRQYGISNIIVIHRLSDLHATGQATFELAQGLLSDAETKVVYAQPDSEIANTRTLLGLNQVEAEFLVGLPQGVALWKVGTDFYPVAHELSEFEATRITDTDASMRTPETASPTVEVVGR